MGAAWRSWLFVLILFASSLGGNVLAANLNSVPLGGSPLDLPGGNFESPVLPISPGFQYNPGGSNWTFSGGAGYSRNGTGFTSGNPNAPQGSQVLFLQGTGSISQNIDFVAGTYTFHFYAAQRGNHQASSQTIELRIDGQSVQQFTPSGSSYQRFTSSTVTLTSGSHSIQLRGLNPQGGDNTAFVDAFQSTRVNIQAISGFELPVITAGSGFQYNPGGPWTFANGGGISKNNTGFTSGNPSAPEGNQVLFLQGVGTASHPVSINLAGFYRFRFKGALRGNNQQDGEEQNIRVSIAGYEVGEFALPDFNYNEMVSTAIYLTAGSYTLTLAGVNPAPGDNTGLVDDVRMEMIHDWQDAYTWGGSVPGSGDVVTVLSNSAVGLRGTMAANRIIVNGELLAAQNQNVSLSSKNIMASGPGSLIEFGQELAPYPSDATITLTATTSDPAVGTMGNKFLVAMNEGTLQIHGKDKKSWTRLGANVAAGSNQITLMEPVDWETMDSIVIVSSRLNWNEAERRAITGISGGGTILTLNANLSFPHKGVVKSYSNGSQNWTADLRAEVGVLTHNIRIQGDAASVSNGYGGHMMIHGIARGYVSGVELFRMGQKAILAKYPFHWHMLGSDGAGQYFKNSAVHHSYNRAITIHGTWGTLVENNFFYDHIGHGVFLEDGSEIDNVIRNNVTLLSRRPKMGEELTPSDNQFNQVQNRTPSSYWITNPQNTFEDNVAAGTEGTGYWYAMPKKPMGLSTNDPRFSSMEPYKLNMTLFKGNSAHSCVSGFDIFDQLDANHAIVPNAGWAENSDHVMENCTWYANDLALYTGIGAGGLSTNLKFRNNVLVENKFATMFASYCVLENSAVVAASGENLFTVPRYAYRIYDGAGQVRNCHFVGWNTAPANFFFDTGAGTKHPNNIFDGNTREPSNEVRISLPNFDIPPVVAHANHPGHPRYWSIVVRDLNGGISGQANTVMVGNHPFQLVGDEYQSSNWTNAYRSTHQFVLSLCTYDLAAANNPNVVVTREKAGTETVNIYYVDGFKEHHQLPFIVNEGFQYTYQYESLPSTKKVRMRMDDATSGDDYLARFKDFGKLGGLSVSSTQGSITSYTSLTALQGATSSGYFKETNGDLYVKAVATGKSQTFNLSWTSNFTVPKLDTDGDEMADSQEISNGRHAFEASDLAAEFNTTGGFEGWSSSNNISGLTVAGGLMSGTSINNGDAMVMNSAYNFKSDEVQHLFIRMKASRNTGVQIFFATNTAPGYSGTRVVTANYTGGGAYQTLTFDMDAHSSWNNTITDLRLDPVSGLGVSFDIDWIRALCQGTDTDGDGVCDFTDVCPSLDDHLIGTSCNDGNAGTSHDIWTSLCSCVGIASPKTYGFESSGQNSERGIRVFPNPVNDHLNIDLGETGAYQTIRLIDLQGRVIREESVPSDQLYLDWKFADRPLVSGVYLMQFIGKQGSKHVQIVKM